MSVFSTLDLPGGKNITCLYLGASSSLNNVNGLVQDSSTG